MRRLTAFFRATRLCVECTLAIWRMRLTGRAVGVRYKMLHHHRNNMMWLMISALFDMPQIAEKILDQYEPETE